MTSPAVSVVVPAYNYARFLPGALASVLGQTWRDFELLVIDDGSTDDTSRVVRPYLADPRVHYQRIDRGGPSRARNVGISRARAPLVAFLDADDMWLAAKLARQLPLFRQEPRPGIVYTRRGLINEAGHDLVSWEPAPQRGAVLEALLHGNFICLSSCMIDRHVFDRVGLFDEALSQAEDYDLWLRAAPHFVFDFVDEPLVRYRIGHASLTCRLEERVRSVEQILHRFQARQHGPNLRPLVRAKLAGTYSAYALLVRDRSRLRALASYLHALRARPHHGPAWTGLATLFLPETVRRLLRRALGRPVDWRKRRRAPRQPPLCERS
jgi:glycosyltransferase involved in cell wall biosynthesis